jgi:AraC-like DNA-binding protein
MEILRDYTMGTGYRDTGFYVRGTGHFMICEPELDKFAHFGEIFWCISGSGIFHYNNQTFSLQPGWVWYYPPGSLHHIIPDPCFHYRWLSIDGQDCGSLFNALRFKPGLNPAGECPEELFAEVKLKLSDGSRQSQLRALDAAFQILTRVMTPAEEPRSTAVQARNFMLKNFADPEISISTLAEMLHIHRITLNRLFISSYGISPGKYLNNIRLQEGIRLLTESYITVKEVAELCGFTSPGYFTKVLHKQTGHTPLEFRRKKETL